MSWRTIFRKAEDRGTPLTETGKEVASHLSINLAKRTVNSTEEGGDELNPSAIYDANRFLVDEVKKSIERPVDDQIEDAEFNQILRTLDDVHGWNLNNDTRSFVNKVVGGAIEAAIYQASDNSNNEVPLGPKLIDEAANELFDVSALA